MALLLLHLNLCCFGLVTKQTLLGTSSHSTRCSLVSVSIFHAFVLLNTSSYFAHSWIVFVAIFLPLFCSKPRVALLAVDLSPFHSLPLWFAQHFELICSLLTCLDSRQLFKNSSSSMRPCKCGSLISFQLSYSFSRLVWLWVGVLSCSMSHVSSWSNVRL